MKDFFELLGEPRRPWINPDTLKARFLAQSATAHPDRFHHAPEADREAITRHAADLNAAYRCLQDPKARLQHLLELERGTHTNEASAPPPSAMDLFAEVHEILRAADCALAERQRAGTAIRKAQVFELALPLLDRLQTVQAKIQTQLADLDRRLLQLNLAWESAPPPGSPLRVNMLPCSRLESLHRELSFLQRWNQQLQERVVELSS